MSWYYSVNNGAHESKYGQPLNIFLDELAAYMSGALEPNDSYSIKSLMIHFRESEPIELLARDAQVYFDRIMSETDVNPIYQPIAGRPLYNAI